MPVAMGRHIWYLIPWEWAGVLREWDAPSKEQEAHIVQYMDFSLLLYIGMLALGVLVGSRKSVRSRKLLWLGRLQSVALIALIAVLGVEIGADDKVISSLGEIGLSALVITVFALAGSLLAVTLVRRLLGLDSRGRTAAQREDEDPALFVACKRPFERLHTSGVRTILKGIAKRAGMSCRVYPHKMRSTLGMNLRNAGVDIGDVSEVLGHANTTVTKRHYAQATPETLRGIRRRAAA